MEELKTRVPMNISHFPCNICVLYKKEYRKYEENSTDQQYNDLNL